MRLVSIVLAMSLFSNIAFADCDFSTLVHNSDGSVTYSKAQHVCVGQLVQDNATKTQQIADLNKAITLKDLAITKSDERAQLWMDTSFKLEDNIQKMNSLKSTNEWVYFGLGVLTIFAAGMATAQLRGNR